MTKGPAEIDTAKLSDADAEVAERDAGLIMAKLPSASFRGPATQIGNARTTDKGRIPAGDAGRRDRCPVGVFRLIRLFAPEEPPSGGRSRKLARKPMGTTTDTDVDRDRVKRRILLHVLPPRLVRIRYYGFLGNRVRGTKPAQLRTLLADRAPPAPEPAAALPTAPQRLPKTAPTERCPRYGQLLEIDLIPARKPWRQPAVLPFPSGTDDQHARPP